MGKQDSFAENSIVELELNMKRKTLHFFINNKQLCHSVDNINTVPLCFGISGSNSSSSVEIVSLLELQKETVNDNNDNNNNIKCTEHNWNKKK
jgi:hypothetical protein